jgi:hypothetical protein
MSVSRKSFSFKHFGSGRHWTRTSDFHRVRETCLTANPCQFTSYVTHKTHQMVQNAGERCNERCKPVRLFLVSSAVPRSVLSPSPQRYQEEVATATVLLPKGLKKVGHSVAKIAAEGRCSNSLSRPDFRPVPPRRAAFGVRRLVCIFMHSPLPLFASPFVSWSSAVFCCQLRLRHHSRSCVVDPECLTVHSYQEE